MVARTSRADSTTPQKVADVRVPGRRSEHAVMTGLRGAWLVLPLALGPAAADALHDISTGPRSLASVALWVLLAIGLTATLIPLPVASRHLRPRSILQEQEYTAVLVAQYCTASHTRSGSCSELLSG